MNLKDIARIKEKNHENPESASSGISKKKDLARELGDLKGGNVEPSKEIKNVEYKKDTEQTPLINKVDNLAETVSPSDEIDEKPKEHTSKEGIDRGGENEQLETTIREPKKQPVNKIPQRLIPLHELNKGLYTIYTTTNRENVIFSTSLRIDQGRLGLIKEWSVTLGLDAQELTALMIDFFRNKFDEDIEEIRKKKRDGLI